MGWDNPNPKISYAKISYSNRIQRWTQAFLRDLTFDSAGEHGFFTTICAPGYSYHGCSVSCSADGSGNFTSAELTCNGDSDAPTGFITTSCPVDAFSQGFQGTSTLTLTLADGETVGMRLVSSGALYILDRNGTYLSSGIWDMTVAITLLFRQKPGGELQYYCESGVSSVTASGESKICESLAYPINC